MDNSFTVGYAKVVGSTALDGPTLRSGIMPERLIDRPEGFETMYDCFALGGLAAHPTGACFGSRVRDDGSVGEYEWQTYREVSTRIDAMAAAIFTMGLAPVTESGHRFFGMGTCSPSVCFLLPVGLCLLLHQAFTARTRGIGWSLPRRASKQALW